MLTHIEITEELSPLFEGLTLGDVGAYRLLRGSACGTFDPASGALDIS